MQRMIGMMVVASGLLTIGCSGESGPPTAPVSGVVTYEGKPVQYANVIFFPQNIPDAHTAFAQTDEEGRFSGMTTAGSSVGSGAAVGSHFVTITEGWPPGTEIPETAEGMQKDPPPGPWGQEYRDSSNPKLKVEIVEGQENHFEWDISE